MTTIILWLYTVHKDISLQAGCLGNTLQEFIRTVETYKIYANIKTCIFKFRYFKCLDYRLLILECFNKKTSRLQWWIKIRKQVMLHIRIILHTLWLMQNSKRNSYLFHRGGNKTANVVVFCWKPFKYLFFILENDVKIDVCTNLQT